MSSIHRPPAGISHPHHGPPQPPGHSHSGSLPPRQQNGHSHPSSSAHGHTSISQPHPSPSDPITVLKRDNEETWVAVGRVAELLDDLPRAERAYESALRHNPQSLASMKGMAKILKARDDYAKAAEWNQAILALDENNGEIWGQLGNCFLMLDELPKAYEAYQQALYRLPDPKDPGVWYGIGILYDRYASLEHAEEAFSNVIHMDETFDKRNEIYFRLGIIYKQQNKIPSAIECFTYIVNTPPTPLRPADIWFQIGTCYETQRDYIHAKDAYERVIRDQPDHTKILTQLGWLYAKQDQPFYDIDKALDLITQSLERESNDAQSWYFLGRIYMIKKNYPKAYEAYQQAVYREARNSNYWCSIGVLYYEIHQFRDALDAYTRAIRLNPYIHEIWYDLGTLYEACNNQVQDALDAYTRAFELDRTNVEVENRLRVLRRNLDTGRNEGPPPPKPRDIDPQKYLEYAAQASNTGAHSQTTHNQLPPSWGGTGRGHAPPQHSGPIMGNVHPAYLDRPAVRSPEQVKRDPYSQYGSGAAVHTNGSGSYNQPRPAPNSITASPYMGQPIKRDPSPPPPHSFYGNRQVPQTSNNDNWPSGVPKTDLLSRVHEDLPSRGPPSFSGPSGSSAPPSRPPPATQYESPRLAARDMPLPAPSNNSGSGYDRVRDRSPTLMFSSRRPSPPPQATNGAPEVKPSVEGMIPSGHPHLPPYQREQSHDQYIRPLGRSPPILSRRESLPSVRDDQSLKRSRTDWEAEETRTREASRSPVLARGDGRRDESATDMKSPLIDRSRDDDRPATKRLYEDSKVSAPPDSEPTSSKRSPVSVVSPSAPTKSPVNLSRGKSPGGESNRNGSNMEIERPAHLTAEERGSPVQRRSEEKIDRPQEHEQDKRPELEPPARAVDVDEDYDKDDDKS